MLPEKREEFKIVELQGRKWRIGSFDALTGSYIAILLLMQVLPMGLESQLGISSSSLSNKRSLMDKDTFIALQKDCLKIVSEVQTIGENAVPIPVMLIDERWGVAGIDSNFSLALSLTIHVLLFNISDFFQGNALEEITKSFQGLNLFNAKE